jgi:hypothetical protein
MSSSDSETGAGLAAGAGSEDAAGLAALVQRRKLNLEAELQSGLSYFSFKSSISGAFNVGLTGSTCTALP